MMTDHPGLNEMLEELLTLLRREESLLQRRAEQFDELHETIRRNNNDRMESLLEEMADAQHQQTDVDQQLREVRQFFNRALAQGRANLKLADLRPYLTAEQAERMADLRGRLIRAAEQLKRKHLDTAVLLTESMKVNRMLLDGLLPNQQSVTTYGTKGQRRWRPGAGVLDAEL
jgi:broad specificity phosphatase PhoE